MFSNLGATHPSLMVLFSFLLPIEIFLGPQGHLTTPNLTTTTLESEIEIHESLPFGRYCRKH